MRSKTLIVLVVLLVAVSGYFFLVDQRSRRRSEELHRSSRRMLPYGPIDVDRVWLLNPYGETIEMLRNGNGWTIVWPVTDDGDAPAIEMLLQQIVPGRKIAEYPEVERLSDYGLGTPYASVVLQSARYGRTDTVHVGDKAPTSFRAYVRLGGTRTVLLTADLAHNVMQKTVFHLRDKNLMRLQSEAITRLAVRSTGPRLEFVRSGSEWLIGDSAMRADRVLVETYLTNLTDAVVYEFPAEDPADTSRFGIGDPQRELLLYSGDGVVRISFGRRDGDYVPALRTGRGKVMMIDSRLLDPFTWVRDDLVVMSLSTAKPGEVAAVKWESPDTTLSIELSGQEWKSIGPSTGTVDGEAVKYLLMLLRSTRFESLFEDPVEAARTLERTRGIRIVLIGTDGETLDLIRLAIPAHDQPIGSSLTAGNAGRLSRGAIGEIERAFTLIGLR